MKPTLAGLLLAAVVLLCSSTCCAPPCDAATKKQDAEQALWGKSKKPLDSICTEAIKQGYRGDCWFLSALALVAHDKPETIKSMISILDDGSYDVLFPKFPEPTHVTAEDIEKARNVGARTTAKYGDWPLVFECAAAKVYPDNIDGGGSLRMGLYLVMGVEAERYAFLPNRYSPALSPKELRDSLTAAHDAGLPLLLATPEKTYMVEMHAYSVIDVTKATAGRKARVIVRNPWGRMGFSRRNNFEIEPLDDGKFSVPIDSLYKYFDEVDIPASAVRIYQSRAPKTPQKVPWYQPVKPGLHLSPDLARMGLRMLVPGLACIFCLFCLMLSNRRFRRVLKGFFILLLAIWYARPVRSSQRLGPADARRE